MENIAPTSNAENDSSEKSSEEIVSLREINHTQQKQIQELHEENHHLKNRVAWFERQLFGRKSEKRLIENPHQQSLLGEPVETPAEPEPTLEITYQRGTAKKQRDDDCVTDAGLRFHDDVPVEVIRIMPPELQGEQAGDFDIIDTRITHKLAQQPASYVVLRYELPVIKKKNTGMIQTTPMPPQVLESAIADVSVLVGLLIDKFQYHLPLYRQHQRMGKQA